MPEPTLVSEPMPPTRYRYTCTQRHIVIVDIPTCKTTYTYRGQSSVYTQYSRDLNTWNLNPPAITCPECGASMSPKERRIKVTKTEKPCGSECLCARGDDCKCSCGGENHGLKYLYYLAQNGGVFPVGGLP